MSATVSNHPLPRRSDLWQSSLGWQPSDPQWALLEQLYQGILDGNRQINLTRLTQPDDFWEKHLWDSFSGLWPWLVPDAARDWTVPPVDRVIDIGTGAGFPGFPAAIAQPQWQVTLLDSTQKKVRFLAELATELGLEQVQAIADRAEFLGHQPAHREQYDLALLRAVGGATTCAEYGLPLVKVGGVAVLYRGQWTADEAKALRRAAGQLGASILAIQAWGTPLTQGQRHCIYLRKDQPTPDAFPRAVGIPAKQPL
jgi:16S rRNA (guanine527-N7)-methyltransferase